MNEKNPEFQAALGEVLRDRRDGEHVTPDRLAAYHHELLAPEEAEVVQEHVAACRRCGDLLLELVAFEEDGETGEGSDVADFETEADWRALRGRLIEDEPAPAPKGRRPRSASRPYMAWGLAASLLISVGMGVWVLKLRNELEAALGPKFNPPIVNLEPDGLTRGGVDESTLRCEKDWGVLLLNPQSVFTPAVEHRVEILDAGGERVWLQEGLMPADAGNEFTIVLPCEQLAAGSYSARLSRGDAEPEVFEFQVTR